MNTRSLLEATAARAADYLDALGGCSVTPTRTVDELRAALGGPLPQGPSEDASVIDSLVERTQGGLLASPSGRFFGFVIGGGLPAALAADWLTSTWDQNAGLYVAGPAASVVEEVCGAWLAELLGLPAAASFAFVTGCQMAHFTCLAAARHHLLERVGWDVEADGLHDAPPIRVIVGEERHATIDRAIRFLGIGTSRLRLIPADGQGRMIAASLDDELRASRVPTIVCAQAGNVNTGAFDPLSEICSRAHAGGAWVHVDGAFGMWAAVSTKHRELLKGCAMADSWALDAHKWLNVPHDSGLAFVAHPAAHQAAMSVHASYLEYSEQGRERDQVDWTPEFSRRARGFAIWAALRALGRSGVQEMIERSCAHAQRFASSLQRDPRVQVLNDVVLNQVLVGFVDPDGRSDALTRAVVRQVQRQGVCWLSGTTWKGRAAMRISVSNWSTTDSDVDRSVGSIMEALDAVSGCAEAG